MNKKEMRGTYMHIDCGGDCGSWSFSFSITLAAAGVAIGDVVVGAVSVLASCAAAVRKEKRHGGDRGRVRLTHGGGGGDWWRN
jgi:hypothetical protein